MPPDFATFVYWSHHSFESQPMSCFHSLSFLWSLPSSLCRSVAYASSITLRWTPSPSSGSTLTCARRRSGQLSWLLSTPPGCRSSEIQIDSFFPSFSLATAFRAPSQWDQLFGIWHPLGCEVHWDFSLIGSWSAVRSKGATPEQQARSRT